MDCGVLFNYTGNVKAATDEIAAVKEMSCRYFRETIYGV
jgi:hypothetical protein